MTSAANPTTVFDPHHDPSVIGTPAADTNLSISDERDAFTILFDNLSFNLAQGTLDGRLVGIVVPLADAGPDNWITFSAGGFAKTGSGNTATLWMRIGTRTSKTVSFPPGYEDSYLEQLTYSPAAGDTEVHLALVLLIERDNDTADQPVLSLDTFDAAIKVRAAVTPATATPAS